MPLDKKQRYAEVQEELAKLAAKFSENVLDATNAFSIVVDDEKRVRGIPADVLQAAREAAQKDRRSDGLEIHAAHAFVSARAAVRG